MTNALMREHSFHHAKYHQNLFAIHFEHTIQSWWTDEYIASFTYTGDDDFVISNATFCTNETATDWVTSFAILINSSTVGGGETVTPVNMNLWSTKTVDATVIWTNDWATPITVWTDWTKMWCIRQRWQGTYFFDMDNSFLMTKNTNITIVSSATTTGTKVRCTLIWFVESDTN